MIITQTPLRISLFGGGTDFPDYFLQEGGCVLTTAIDKYIYVVLKNRFDRKIRVSYTKTEIVDSVDELQHELIRESLRASGIDYGVEIVTLADIPSEGSGLGSSSTLTVGTILALTSFLGGLGATPFLATLACSIERDILQKPIGYQDQYIAAYGGFQYLTFGTDGSVKSTPVSLGRDALWTLNDNLLLFYTGTLRKAESILAEQQASIPAHLLQLRELKQIAKYVYHEICSHNNMDIVGEFLHQSWEIKKRLSSNITNPTIDSIYETARLAGALGGKLCGAGGGGFLLLYVPYENQPAVRQALHPLQELPFNINAPGSKVILNIDG
jgi:D-glycero-alpha-D-manno-heptose-7-phosphate kinase